jgi:hypothetical protein
LGADLFFDALARAALFVLALDLLALDLADAWRDDALGFERRFAAFMTCS